MSRKYITYNKIRSSVTNDQWMFIRKKTYTGILNLILIQATCYLLINSVTRRNVIIDNGVNITSAYILCETSLYSTKAKPKHF